MNTPAEHWRRVATLAQKLHTDGCSGVPDFWFRLCCYEHDIAYRTGCDVLGNPITRWEADRALRQCMAEFSPVGRASGLAWTYWLGVRLFGRSSWTGATNGEAATNLPSASESP